MHHMANQQETKALQDVRESEQVSEGSTHL